MEALSLRFCVLFPLAAPSDGSGLIHEHESPLHVHGGCDELQMAGVAGKAAIADTAEAIPLLHRGVGPLDAGAYALRPMVEPLLPGLEWIAAMLDLPDNPVADALAANEGGDKSRRDICESSSPVQPREVRSPALLQISHTIVPQNQAEAPIKHREPHSRPTAAAGTKIAVFGFWRLTLLKPC